MTDKDPEEPAATQAGPDVDNGTPAQDSDTQPQKAQKPHLTLKGALTKTAAATGKTFDWLGRTLTSRTSLVILALVLIYAFAPVERAIQAVESRFHDHIYFNPAREGAIVVDTPQLFTRERLINERLEESAWIENQLDKVDELLENGKFAQVDSVSVTQSLLSIMGEGGNTELAGTDFEKLGALAKELGATQPTPLQQFRDAKNYRERLSLQRYDSILDDAHDIGSNTLHRMNFRLTLSPARKRSDSVAAVSITVREPRDARLLFDHYGRLVIETRKKMEETVASLLRDRMLILTRDFQFQTSELELIDKILHNKVVAVELTGKAHQNSQFTEISREAEALVDHMIDLILDQQIEKQEAQAQAYLYTLISSIGIPELTAELMPHYPEKRPTYWNKGGGLSGYATTASRKLIDSCGAPFRLTSLSPDDFSQNDSRYFALKNRYINNQIAAASGPPPANAKGPGPDGAPESGQQQANGAEASQRLTGQQVAGGVPEGQLRAANVGPSGGGTSQPPPSSEQREALNNAKRQLSDNFENSLRQPFTYPCPTRENQITLAKLRLLGRLEMLERAGTQNFATCKTAYDMREKLLAFIGGDLPPGEELKKLRSDFAADCPASTLMTITEQLAKRVALTGGDYARIGIVMTMQEKLSKLQLDTSSRNVRLGNFFDFDVTRCDLKTCKLRTRSKAEALAERTNDSREFAHRALEKTNTSVRELVMALEEINKSVAPEKASFTAEYETATVSVEPKIVGLLDDRLSDLEKRIQEAGREEALRLFLELRCFADARSYTVWPRAGERLASFERDSVQSGARFDFDSTLQKFTGLQASSDASSIMRQERDHIFGIGDWGNDSLNEARVDGNDLTPCSRELEAVLDGYKTDGTFVEQFAAKLHSDTLGPRVTKWWGQVNAVFHAAKQGQCPGDSCFMTLEDLMQIAQGLELPNTETKFSWIIAPRRETQRRASRHVPMSVPLSALISLPSWWGHAELEISTCWVCPKDLRDRIPSGNLCDTSDNPESQAIRRSLHVPLPGKAQDVLQRIGFFIIRTPYLDTNWNQEEEVEAGRPAKIRLTGSRLWKNPRVRIGNQWHDKIEVLPNMQGVIASFECVQPTLRPGKLSVRLGHEDLPRFGEGSDAQFKSRPECDEETGGAPAAEGKPPGDGDGKGQQNTCRPKASASEELYVDDRQAEIWTSEGRTSPTVVKVHAFRPRYFRNGEIERPCWLLKDVATGQSPGTSGDGNKPGQKEGSE